MAEPVPNRAKGRLGVYSRVAAWGNWATTAPDEKPWTQARPLNREKSVSAESVPKCRGANCEKPADYSVTRAVGYDPYKDRHMAEGTLLCKTCMKSEPGTIDYKD